MNISSNSFLDSQISIRDLMDTDLFGNQMIKNLKEVLPGEEKAILDQLSDTQFLALHKATGKLEIEKLKRKNRSLQQEILRLKSQIDVCCSNCRKKIQNEKEGGSFWYEFEGKIRDFSLHKRRTNGRQKYWYASRYHQGKVIQIYIGKDKNIASKKIDQWYRQQESSTKSKTKKQKKTSSSRKK